MMNISKHYLRGVKMEMLDKFRFQLKEIDGRIIIYDNYCNEERELI